MLIYILLFAMPLCLSLMLTPGVRRLAIHVKAVDQPGERKIHTSPIPRWGGVSIVLSGGLTVLIGLGLERLNGNLVAFSLKAWSAGLAGCVIVFLTGVLDDLRPMPAGVKFGLQAVAAGITIGLGVRIEHVSLFGSSGLELGWFSVPITALWIIGITNAFNLIDGLDGLATGLATIVACSSAAVFFLCGNVQEAVLLFILIGALLGFLPYNFNPATIFLGDSGSMFLGYVLAVAAVNGTQKSPKALAVMIPLLIFGLPIVDTLLSMARRFVGSLQLFRSCKVSLKERFLSASCMFRPDRRHIHHRLLALGFSHRNAVLCLYALALGLSSLALLSVLAQYRNAGVILVAVGLATYIGIRKLKYDEMVFLRTGTLLLWNERLQFNSHFFLGFVDMILITSAYWGAFLLKYEDPLPKVVVTWYLNTYPLVLVAQLAVFYALGLYRGAWRVAEVRDLMRIALVVPPAVALSYIIAVLREPPPGTLGFFWIDALVLGACVAGIRSAYKHLVAYAWPRDDAPTGTALIYGADRHGQLILRELLQNPHIGLLPIGFLDDDVTLQGQIVNRMPVLGSGDDLKSVVDDQPVSTLILAAGPVQGYRLRKALSVCQERGITILQGSIQLVPLRTNGTAYPMYAVQSDSQS